jgi:hypothetical protein
MEEEALDRTQCRPRFRIVYGPVVRQTTQMLHDIAIRKFAKKLQFLFAILTIQFFVHRCYLGFALAEIL